MECGGRQRRGGRSGQEQEALRDVTVTHIRPVDVLAHSGSADWAYHKVM